MGDGAQAYAFRGLRQLTANIGAELVQDPTMKRDEAREPTGRVLAIDLDDLTLERVRSAVRGTELTVSVVTPQEAIACARVADVPVIFLLEWLEDLEEEATRLCEAIRGVARPGRCYILALGGVAEQSALSRALSGSANGVLRRPFGGDWLLVHLRHALRVMSAAPALPSLPRAALDEALGSPDGGEVVVRSGEVVAHIHVQRGHIVWAHLSSVPATMEEVARCGGVSLEPDVIAAVKAECKATGAHFMEVLVKWGAIDEDRAREAVRAFVAERVRLVLELPDALALFLPKARSHSERLRFRASEIPSLRTPPAGASGFVVPDGAGPQSSRSVPVLPLQRIAGVVHEAMRVEGALGAAVLERRTGACLFHAGATVDTEAAWSLVSALAGLGASADEIIAAAGDQIFLARPLRSAPSLVLFLALSASAITLGLARAMVARITAAGGDATPAPAGGPPPLME